MKHHRQLSIIIFVFGLTILESLNASSQPIDGDNQSVTRSTTGSKGTRNTTARSSRVSKPKVKRLYSRKDGFQTGRWASSMAIAGTTSISGGHSAGSVAGANAQDTDGHSRSRAEASGMVYSGGAQSVSHSSSDSMSFHRTKDVCLNPPCRTDTGKADSFVQTYQPPEADTSAETPVQTYRNPKTYTSAKNPVQTYKNPKTYTSAETPVQTYKNPKTENVKTPSYAQTHKNPRINTGKTPNYVKNYQNPNADTGEKLSYVTTDENPDAYYATVPKRRDNHPDTGNPASFEYYEEEVVHSMQADYRDSRYSYVDSKTDDHNKPAAGGYGTAPKRSDRKNQKPKSLVVFLPQSDSIAAPPEVKKRIAAVQDESS